MSSIKRIVLDVLKLHHPNVLDFAKRIAEQDTGYYVKVTVAEMDEKTESIVMTIEGEDIQFDSIVETISNMGATVHSIDEVEVTRTTSQSEAGS